VVLAPVAVALAAVALAAVLAPAAVVLVLAPAVLAPVVLVLALVLVLVPAVALAWRQPCQPWQPLWPLLLRPLSLPFWLLWSARAGEREPASWRPPGWRGTPPSCRHRPIRSPCRPQLPVDC
jgi:hypothetical protein